jgi:hypothetical protein
VKVGDLVTLSTYALQSVPLTNWRIMIWEEKKPLAGIIIEKRTSSYIRPWISENEKVLYFVKWLSSDGPSGRWGRSIRREYDGFFYRNDLKFLTKQK